MFVIVITGNDSTRMTLWIEANLKKVMERACFQFQVIGLFLPLIEVQRRTEGGL